MERQSRCTFICKRVKSSAILVVSDINLMFCVQCVAHKQMGQSQNTVFRVYTQTVKQFSQALFLLAKKNRFMGGRKTKRHGYVCKNSLNASEDGSYACQMSPTEANVAATARPSIRHTNNRSKKKKKKHPRLPRVWMIRLALIRTRWKMFYSQSVIVLSPASDDHIASQSYHHYCIALLPTAIK